MHNHRCGPGCSDAAALLKVVNSHMRSKEPSIVAVKSWCRICGVPVLLEVITDYDQAVRHFYAIDDTPMVHKGVHTEQGGWGVSWRLDEVLARVFPESHREELWPMSPWWDGRYGDPENDHEPVEIMSQADLAKYRDFYMDYELRMLEKFVNKAPRSAEELSLEFRDSWDSDQVRERFEILGFKSPFVIAIDKETGLRGSLVFQDTPRVYFGWDPERVI